nr:hypothetical protein [Tanacetum cinerariifolium]
MHILKDPSFFFTNKTGAPHGDKRYGAQATGEAPGTNSIWNSICRGGGSPGALILEVSMFSTPKTSEYGLSVGASSEPLSSTVFHLMAYLLTVLEFYGVRACMM